MDDQAVYQNQRNHMPSEVETSKQAEIPEELPPMSKSRQKKLLRDQRWEANREARKLARKEKTKKKRAQIRAERVTASESLPTPPTTNGSITTTQAQRLNAPRPKKLGKKAVIKKVLLPVTFIIDCSYEHLMQAKEINSLSSQITRCYSDIHRAPFQAHLVISSFQGKLKERFDNVLIGHYRGWKGVRTLEEDFSTAAKQAQTSMKENSSMKLEGAFRDLVDPSSESSISAIPQSEVIYLTSDSPNVLSSLTPYSTYIIGGLVDKNRHKGVCYKKAMDHGLKTARLPIDVYMRLDGRQVLTVNHVCEIMIKWLEYGDWGKAFMEVIPRRKGGTLKVDSSLMASMEEKGEEDDGEDVLKGELDGKEHRDEEGEKEHRDEEGEKDREDEEDENQASVSNGETSREPG